MDFVSKDKRANKTKIKFNYLTIKSDLLFQLVLGYTIQKFWTNGRKYFNQFYILFYSIQSVFVKIYYKSFPVQFLTLVSGLPTLYV